MVVWEHHVKCLGNDGLQGQQISAQGNALGNDKRQKYNPPCKGKSIMNIFVLLPLQGDFFPHHSNLRALPWANCSLAFQAV